jgi:hypothetical protein
MIGLAGVTKLFVSGSTWNRAPQRATVPYAKSFSLLQMFLSRSALVKRGWNKTILFKKFSFLKKKPSGHSVWFFEGKREEIHFLSAFLY